MLPQPHALKGFRIGTARIFIRRHQAEPNPAGGHRERQMALKAG
jgi:hypothetical protein